MSHTISDIIIYPVKSLGGIHLKQSAVEIEGLKHDRRWMLIDESNRFMTQRETPAMCLFKPAIHKNGLEISHLPSMEKLVIHHDECMGEEFAVTVWDDVVQAQMVSIAANQWFSRLLNKPCRLVKMTTNTQRKTDVRYASKQEQMSFADSFPVLMIGEAALNDLNSKLDIPIDMNRFRPNIVFKGGEAFAEDKWKDIDIGSTQMRVCKPCARCAITTINQQTAVLGKEPLKTLATYRKVNNKIMFGQNVLVLNPGTISIGDLITINSFNI